MPILLHLDSALLAFASELGEGNKTLGIRRALSYCQTAFAPGVTNVPAGLLSPQPRASTAGLDNAADVMKLTRCVSSISLAARSPEWPEGWLVQRVVARRLQWSKLRYAAAQGNAVAAGLLETREPSADGISPAMVRPYVNGGEV